jgi:hypothetical protein
VLTYLNPTEVDKHTMEFQSGGKMPFAAMEHIPQAKFFTDVIKDARGEDGKWDLQQLRTIARYAYYSPDKPIESNPRVYVPYSSRWGYETLKLLQNPLPFNNEEGTYKEPNAQLTREIDVNAKHYTALAGWQTTKNIAMTPPKYTPLELNNMHLFSDGRRDMLAPFYDRYPFAPKKPNPYLNKTIKEQSNG